MVPVYDHQKKAGNQGDVVKHVALIAALDETIEGGDYEVFEYADLYAGYARNPVLTGGEWTYGIGKLVGDAKLASNKHTQLWSRWYLSRPQLLGGCYPGSSLIAFDVCAHRKVKSRLSLWDTSPAAILNLKSVFGTPEHEIFKRPADPRDRRFKEAHFVLIDPPDSRVETWKAIRRFLSHTSPAILVWLPVHANTSCRPPTEDRRSGEIRAEARDLGFAVTTVRWSLGGRTIGCQLLYRGNAASKQALCEAVVLICGATNWECCCYGST